MNPRGGDHRDHREHREQGRASLTAWGVMLRGVRYRAGRSLVVFALAAVATTAAVLAPAYARAAQQSVLTDGLRAAPSDATMLVVGAKGTGESVPAAFRDTDDMRLSVNRALQREPAVAARLERPVAAVDTEALLLGRGDPLTAKLAYRDQACYHLRVSGECPQEPGQVLVSQRSASAHRVGVGDQLTVRLGSPTAGRDRRLTVVGLYTPRDATEAYWGRTVYFAAGAADPTSPAERIDALFTGVQDDVRAERGGTVSTRLEYPLRTGSVRLDDTEPLRDGLAALASDLRGDDLEAATALPSVLDDVAADQRAIGRSVPVIAVPLLLLCWFVLFLLVASLTEERGPEIALAKLRGYPSGRVARFGLGESLLLVALAAPAGLILGLALVELAARLVLAAGTHVEVRWPVFVATGLALAGAAAAAALAARRTLGREVLGLLRRVPERAHRRAGLADGLVVALAAASLVVAVGDRSAPLALLAPPLLAVVAGVATARLLAIWSRLRLRGARRRGAVSTLLSAAQLARRPGGRRVVVVVTVAVALLSFAATAWDAAAQARRDHAEDAMGAQRVYTVLADHPAALSAALARADPGGHAMAVVRASQRYGDGYLELVGVQSAALPGVALWRGEGRDQLARLAGMLHPAVAEPLRLGADLTVDAAVEALPARQPPLRLAALVGAPGEPPRTVPLGTLTRGLRGYHAALPGCGGGCRLLALSLGRAGGAGSEPVAAVLSVRAVHTGGTDVDAGFPVPGRWRAASRHGVPAQVSVRPGAALGVDLSSTDPGDAVVEYVDTPDALPAVLAGAAPADDAGAGEFKVPGFAEQPQPFVVAARTGALPRVGTHGLLFDLDYAVRVAERTSSLADNDTLRYEVWAGPQAPADLPARLAAGGVQVLRTESLGATLDRLGRRAPALGLWLYLLAGAVSIALCLGVVLLSAYVGVHGRLYELAALRVSGVRRRVLRRALLREYRLLLGVPLLVGLAAGVAGALVMLPGIPLVTVAGPTRGVRYHPALGALPAAVLASVLAMVLAVALVLRLLGRATPDRLRDGAP
jgi:putative ABC transport system permease protein